MVAATITRAGGRISCYAGRRDGRGPPCARQKKALTARDQGQQRRPSAYKLPFPARVGARCPVVSLLRLLFCSCLACQPPSLPPSLLLSLPLPTTHPTPSKTSPRLLLPTGSTFDCRCLVALGLFLQQRARLNSALLSQRPEVRAPNIPLRGLSSSALGLVSQSDAHLSLVSSLRPLRRLLFP